MAAFVSGVSAVARPLRRRRTTAAAAAVSPRMMSHLSAGTGEHATSAILAAGGGGGGGGDDAQRRLVVPPRMANMPKVPYKAKGSDKYEFIDIFNRFYRERIIFINQDIDDEVANQTIAVLLFLESEDDKAEVQMYFNCPGGATSSGLAIYDCMRAMKYPITTLNLGFAAGIAAFLVGAGAPGKRMALPNARFLMQAPSLDAPVRGQASDIAAEVGNVLRQRRRILEVVNNITGLEIARLDRDFQRDFYLTAYEAREYNLIDRVLQPRMRDAAPIYQQDPLYAPPKRAPSF